MSSRRPLTDRLSGFTPQQRENAGVTVVLCELIDELIEATNRQSALLEERLEKRAGTSDGHNRGGRKPTAAAPSGDEDQEEGDSVLLREPAVPPPDPDVVVAADPAANEPTAGDTSTNKPVKRAPKKAPTSPASNKK